METDGGALAGAHATEAEFAEKMYSFGQTEETFGEKLAGFAAEDASFAAPGTLFAQT